MKCPCKNQSSILKQFYFKGEIDFVLCSHCSLVFRKKFPSTSELATLYKDAYSDQNINISNTNQESGLFATEVYSSYIHENFFKSGCDQRFLDYGAGTGQLVETLKKYNIIIDGLEFSDQAIKYCSEKRGIFLKNNLKNVPNNYYDFVSMIEVIEHVTDLETTLEELNRITKPGGTIFVTTPNRAGLRSLIEKGFWKEARKKFHLFLFNYKSLYFHFEKSGFHQIQRIKYNPIQKKGLFARLLSRILQTLGLGGTLCITARLKK
jgi:SAM-dependent methyltransferase